MTSWTDAANLGIDALTHGVPVSPYLLPKDKQRILIENGMGPFDHFFWLSLVNLNSNSGTENNETIRSLVSLDIGCEQTVHYHGHDLYLR